VEKQAQPVIQIKKFIADLLAKLWLIDDVVFATCPNPFATA